MIMSALFLAVVGTVVYVVVTGSSRSRTAGSQPAGPAGDVEPDTSAVLADDLRRWCDAGLLTADQAAAIADHERSRRRTADSTAGRTVVGGRQLPDVTEALGYLGGVLALVGMSLLVGRYWSDLAVAGRLGLSGGLAAATLAAGFAVPEDREPALKRLRWFLWAISSAATAVFGGVIAWESVGSDDLRVPFAGAVAVGVHGSLLWWRRRRPVQQLVFLSSVAVALGTGVGHLSGGFAAGMAVWSFGVVCVLAGLRHATVLPALTTAVGSASAVVGAMVVADDSVAVSFPLASASAAALVAVAMIERIPTTVVERRVLAMVGGVGLVSNVPATIGYYADEGAIATGLVVWAVGAGLVRIGQTRSVRIPLVATVAGSVALVGGAAVVGTELDRIGPVFGIVTALGLIALGVELDRFALTLAGSVGLLIHVPWAIVELFPGEGRAPLLIMVSGALIVAIAALLARTRLRRGPPGTAGVS